MNNSNIRENPNGDQRAYYATKNFALSGKIMMSAIIILFTVVLLILCLHIYARWFLLRSRRNQRRRGTNFVFSGENGQNPTTNTANAQRGLEISILRSLPIFVFTTNSHKDGLECAVCLCEIEENEKLRVLPKCNHSFHLDCIDMWFHSHSTCPLCRSAVTPDVPAPVTQENLNPDLGQIPVEEDLEAPLSHAGICSSCRHAEESSSSSSSGVRGSSSEEEGSSSSQKGISITVELPRRTESFRAPGDDPAISPGLKSSGSRMLSLKRILSRDRRASLGISFSFSSETDLEQGGAEHR